MRNLEIFKRARVNQAWGAIEWPGKIPFDLQTLDEEMTNKMGQLEQGRAELAGA